MNGAAGRLALSTGSNRTRLSTLAPWGSDLSSASLATSAVASTPACASACAASGVPAYPVTTTEEVIGSAAPLRLTMSGGDLEILGHQCHGRAREPT